MANATPSVVSYPANLSARMPPRSFNAGKTGRWMETHHPAGRLTGLKPCNPSPQCRGPQVPSRVSVHPCGIVAVINVIVCPASSIPSMGRREFCRKYHNNKAPDKATDTRRHLSTRYTSESLISGGTAAPISCPKIKRSFVVCTGLMMARERIHISGILMDTEEYRAQAFIADALLLRTSP